MGNNRLKPKGFLRECRDKRGLMYLVGANDLSDKQNPYYGSVLQLTWDDTWLKLADDCDGCAMVNIEAIPHLRRALAKVSRHIKETRAANIGRVAALGHAGTLK